jgi:hypothetical protein
MHAALTDGASLRRSFAALHTVSDGARSPRTYLTAPHTVSVCATDLLPENSIPRMKPKPPFGFAVLNRFKNMLFLLF